MRSLRLAVPLAALAVLTAACGAGSRAPGDPTPGIAPAGGPGLKRVWQVPHGTVDEVTPLTVVGNVVLGEDKTDTSGSPGKRRVVFIDGTTGRVKGRAGIGDVEWLGVRAVTDSAGRPLVAIDPRADLRQRVYDTDGKLVWRARTAFGAYAGGYTVEPEGPTGKARAVVRTASGRMVATLPLDRYYNATLKSGIGLQVVRRGLLVASGFGANESEVALLDVSRPGPAGVTRLRLPFKPDSDTLEAHVEVRGEHLYVSWRTAVDDETDKPYPAPIARYDVPGTRPVWHTLAPKGADGSAGSGIRVFPAANGGGDVLTVATPGSAPARFWLLDPATGGPIGPGEGRKGRLVSASGGRAYVTYNLGKSTDVIDLRTGAVRRIATVIDGITPSGDLVDAHAAAYRWH